MTRRTAITALGAAAMARPQTTPTRQDPDVSARFGLSAPKRTAPMLCVFSRNMEKIPYAEIGAIAQQIGYEGIDLTVMIGGHVDPRITNVDLVRAFESVRGAGLEVPMITTSITSTTDPTAYAVLYLTGHSQVPLFQLGLWEYPDTGDIQQRLAQVRRDLTQVVSMGRSCDISAMFPNRTGYVGEFVWDTQIMIGDMDPRGVGYIFDPAEATAASGPAGWDVALRLALPRLKAVTLQDFYWKKDGADWKMQKCPLGEGMVDWTKFFAALAAAHFTGPVSIHMEYPAQDAVGAMSKDLEFARKQVEQGWPAKPHS